MTVSSTVHVVLAYPWTDDEGIEHQADEHVEIPLAAGGALVSSGRARYAPAPPTPAPKEDVVASKEKETHDG